MYHSRIFLNKKGGMAAMQTSFEASSHYISCDVTISDCSRQICLDFNSASASDFKQKALKLDLIISELTKLRKQMEEHQASPEFKKAFK